MTFCDDVSRKAIMSQRACLVFRLCVPDIQFYNYIVKRKTKRKPKIICNTIKNASLTFSCILTVEIPARLRGWRILLARDKSFISSMIYGMP